MLDTSELIQKAEDLKQQAEHEPDARVRDLMTRMADRYVHLAQSLAWSREHPPSPASLAEVLVSRDKS
jgi:hypothetical protein